MPSYLERGVCWAGTVPKYGTVLHGTQVWYGTACFCYAAAVLYLRVGRCTCSYSCTSATRIYVPVHVQIYTTCRYRYLTVAQLNLSTSYVAVVLCTTASRYHSRTGSRSTVDCTGTGTSVQL